jgi:hypothetical protein
MSPNTGGGGGVAGVSANEYSCAHGAQINFGDLAPYLTYDSKIRLGGVKSKSGSVGAAALRSRPKAAKNHRNC